MRLLFFFVFTFVNFIYAQDDLFDLLDNNTKFNAEVKATFKGTRVINGQSIELPAKGALQFVIEHRFGTINSGPYELWGIDQPTMRMSLDYGISPSLALGVARNSFEKTYEVSAKSKLLKQRIEGSPISISSYHAMFLNSLHWLIPERNNLFMSRLSYVHQLMIARKVNPFFSIQITPSYVHRNLVETKIMNNDYIALGFGSRYKLTKRLSINAEYFYQFNRPDENYINSMSIGFDIETGGHVFQLHLTNSQGMFERAFIGETSGSWS